MVDQDLLSTVLSAATGRSQPNSGSPGRAESQPVNQSEKGRHQLINSQQIQPSSDLAPEAGALNSLI